MAEGRCCHKKMNSHVAPHLCTNVYDKCGHRCLVVPMYLYAYMFVVCIHV